RGRVQQTLRESTEPRARRARGGIVRRALDLVQGCLAEGEVDGARGCPRGGAVDGPAGRQPDQRQRLEILQLRSAGRSEGRGPEYPLVDWRVAMAGPRCAPGLSEESRDQ